MYEEPTRTPHEPTKYEQERAQQYVKYGWSPRYAKYDHHPSGKLSVRTITAPSALSLPQAECVGD